MMKKSLLITYHLLNSLCILLFVYAALSKLMAFSNFQAQLSQSPLISAFTGMISYSIPMAELVIAVLLFFPVTRKFGHGFFFALLFAFTTYIVGILHFAPYVPCSCGGVLESLNWEQHLYFNLVFLLASLFCLWVDSDYQFTWIRWLLLLPIPGVIGMYFLFQWSENTIHQENPFIRRFVQASNIKKAEKELPASVFYMAGYDHNQIYLANPISPLKILEIDTDLKNTKEYTIELENSKFPFTNVMVRIHPPYFYVMDGSIPIVYRGKISDWKANIQMKENGYFFSKAEVVDSTKIAFRAHDKETFEHVLGTFTLGKHPQIFHAKNLLTKQLDGVFDTDGKMFYERISNTLHYVYYYRNEYLITNDQLELVAKGLTIDTNRVAKISLYKNPKTGEKKLTTPFATIHQLITANEQFLLINATRRGKYEPVEMWKQSSVVDIYNWKDQTYHSSIYIPHQKQQKLKDMMWIHNHLYVIIGNQIQKIQWNQVPKYKKLY